MEIPYVEMKSHLLTCLLQEQSQYREEVRMFDTHFFRVLLTYVTGLIAAFGWLGSQVLERAGKLADNPALSDGSAPLQLGAAVAQIFGQLANGPFFYLFAGVPIITSIMFLMVARDWTSLNEKFNALKRVSEEIAGTVDPCRTESKHQIFELDRGHHIPGRKPRAFVEGTLFAFWFLMAIGLSAFILLEVAKFADSPMRFIWLWFGGGFGIILGIISIVFPLILFKNRAYKAA